MEIRYYYSKGLISFNCKEQLILLETQLISLTLYDLYLILKSHSVEMTNIDHIKYYDYLLEGWITFPNEMHSLPPCLRLILVSLQEEDEDFCYTEEEELENLKVRLNKLEISFKDSTNNNKTHSAKHHEPQLFRSNSGNAQDLSFPCAPCSVNEEYLGENLRAIDVGILFANPIIFNKNQETLCLDDPFELSREVVALIDELNTTDQKIISSCQVATISNFKEIILEKPRIIHLFINGGFIDNKFYCFFENENGALLKVSMEELNNLFEETINYQTEIELLIISSKFSENMLEFFKGISHVKSIISVHCYNEFDEASKIFFKTIYCSLFNGKIINDALEEGKNMVNLICKGKIEICCCYHDHKPSCKWISHYSPENYSKIHEQHSLKNCNCNMEFFNHHKKNCKDAINYNEKFEYEESNNSIIICCCRKDINHEKAKKILFKFLEENSEKPLFPVQKNGKFEVKSKNCVLNLKFNFDLKRKYIGRNRELYEVINFFNSNQLTNRFITVISSKGYGKTTFAKMVGAFMYERNHFPDGIIFLDKKKEMSVMALESIICNYLDIEVNFNTNHNLLTLIKNLKILFIIQIEYEASTDNDFLNFLQNLTKQTVFCKIIIVSPQILGFEKEGEIIRLKALDKTNAAKLLLYKAQFNLQGIFRDLNYLEEHELIKFTKGIPTEISNLAHLLKYYKPEIIIDFIRNGLGNPEQFNKYIEDKLSNFENPELFKEVLFTIFILPQGLLDDDIISIYDLKISKIILSGLEDNNQGLVTIEKHNDINQLHFQINQDILSMLKSIDLPFESKIKVYENLFKLYTTLLRRTIFNFFKDSPCDFSAAQNYGIWKTFNREKENLHSFSIKLSNTDTIKARYQLIEENILKLIHDLEKEKLFSEEIKEGLEQFSICIPTALWIFGRNTDCMTRLNFFLEVCEMYDLKLAKARLSLFFFSISKIEENEEEFRKINQIFEEKDCILGVAENHFCRLVINLKKSNSNFTHVKLKKFPQINQDFAEAEKIYTFSNDKLGLARLYYIWADYKLQHYINDGIESLDGIMEYMKISAKHFKEKGRLILQFRCYLGMSKCHLLKNQYDEAKTTLKKDAMALTKDRKKLVIDTPESMKKEINEIENNINDKMQYESKNLFTFIKAHQLVKNIAVVNRGDDNLFRRSDSDLNELNPKNDEIQEIYQVMMVHSDFRMRIKESLKNSKLRINLNFDILNRSNLKKVIENGGKLLHISSVDFNEYGSLFIEGKNGESLEVFEDELNYYLANAKFLYEIVIVSIPQSKNLATIFHNNKVKHVIFFEFNKDFLNYALEQQSHSILKIINNFTIFFTSSLLRESNVFKSFIEAKQKFLNEINEIKHRIKYYSGVEFIEEDYIFLLSKNEEDFKLNLDLNIDKSNIENNIEDVSKTGSLPVNIEKRREPLIGRKTILYEIFKNLSSNHLNINVFGSPGLGKTCIMEELSFYAYMRSYFYSIIYFDLSQVKSIDKLKELLKEQNLFNVIKELENSNKYDDHILVILDNCDEIINSTFNQFYLLLNSIGFERVYYVLTTVNQILNPNMPCYHIPVPILTLEEQIAFFFNFCNRDIEKYEIDTEEEVDKDKLSIKELLEYSKRIKLCYGYPKILKKLCDICSKINLKQIKLSEFLPDFILNNLKKKQDMNQFYGEFNKTHSFVKNKTLMSKFKGLKTVTRISYNPELIASVESSKSGIESKDSKYPINHAFSTYKESKTFNRLNSVVSRKTDSLNEEVNQSLAIPPLRKSYKRSEKHCRQFSKEYDTLSGQSTESNQIKKKTHKNSNSSKFKKLSYLTEKDLENTIPENNNTLFSFKKNLTNKPSKEDDETSKNEKELTLKTLILNKNSSSNVESKDENIKNDDNRTPELKQSLLTLQKLKSKNSRIVFKNNFTLKKLDSNKETD